MKTKYTVRVKILRDNTKPALQDDVNIYLDEIKKRHAVLVGQPKLQLVKVNTTKLENYVKRYEINQYNIKTSLNISLDTSLSDLRAEQLTSLLKQIEQDFTRIQPVIYYEQICYKVLTDIYESNIKIFN